MRAASVFLAIALALADPEDPVLPPIAWPSQHTHFEMMYTIDDGGISEKPVWYDFLNLHYRADGHLVNNVPFATVNQSSYWLGDDLYIYTYDINNCVHLNLGFAMMRPTWFMDNNASIFGSVYATQRSDSAANYYTSVVLTRKDGAGQGYFDYYSSNKTGSAFNMHAPSPAGFVVNEYLVPPVPTPFAPNDPVFALPAGIPCINTTLTAALQHPGGLNAHLAEALGLPSYRLAMPELYLSSGWRAAVLAAGVRL